MTVPQTRPRGYGIIDDNDAGQPAGPVREIPESSNGFQVNQVPPRTKWNHPQQRHGRWARWFDQQTPIHPQFFGLQSTRLSLDTLVFSTGGGLVQTVEENCNYVVNGYVVDLSIAELQSWGLSPYTFEASKDTHVYAQRGTDLTTPPLRFEAVALATPPAPGPNELHLGTMTTDATDATLWTEATNDANSTRRVRVDRVWHFEQAIENHRSVNWLAPFGVTRTHKRQNASTNARGFSYSDTRTFEGLAAGANVATILNVSQLPAGSRIAVTARVAAVDATNPDGVSGAVAFFTTAFAVSTGGVISTLVGTSPDKSSLGSLLSSIFCDSDDGTSIDLLITVAGGSTANVECSFDAAIIGYDPP